MPVQVIYGEEDGCMDRSTFQRLASGSGATVGAFRQVAVPGVVSQRQLPPIHSTRSLQGHWLHLEEPLRVAELLESWISAADN